MHSDRRSGIIVGLLYIVATVAGVLTFAPMSVLAEGSGIIVNAGTNENQVLILAALQLVMAVTVAGVAFMLYPILSRTTESSVDEGMAVWYVGTRLTESTLFLVGILALLALIGLSKELAAATGVEGSSLLTIGMAFMDSMDYAFMLGQSVFCVGAVMLYYLIYRSRILPRWISIWGLIGAPLMLVASLSLPVTGDPNSTFSSILYAPLALQEMVMAVWMIVKGFDMQFTALGSTA